MFKRLETQESVKLLRLCIDNIERGEPHNMMEGEVEELYESFARLSRLVEFTQKRMQSRISFDIPRLRPMV